MGQIDQNCCHLKSYTSHELTLWRYFTKTDCIQAVIPQNTNRSNRSKSLISSKGNNLISFVSHNRTWQRSCPKVHPYQVWLWSLTNCTCESANRLNSSKSLISSLNSHLTSHVSHERTQLSSCPYQVWPQSEKNCTHESHNGLSKSKSLISSWSTHLMSYVSYECTWWRSCLKVYPYYSWTATREKMHQGQW